MLWCVGRLTYCCYGYPPRSEAHWDKLSQLPSMTDEERIGKAFQYSSIYFNKVGLLFLDAVCACVCMCLCAYVLVNVSIYMYVPVPVCCVPVYMSMY